VTLSFRLAKLGQSCTRARSASNDLIYLVMRLYWPKTEPPSILPAGEGTWKPPGMVKAK
jgi:hypothetical protein